MSVVIYLGGLCLIARLHQFLRTFIDQPLKVLLVSLQFLQRFHFQLQSGKYLMRSSN